MKDFLKMFVASVFALVLVIAGAALVLLLVVALAAGQDGGKGPGDAMLVFDFSSPIADRPSREGPADALQDAMSGRRAKPVTLRAVTQAIRRGAEDDEIKGILLTGNVVREGYSSGPAALKEIRESLAEFRKSGKKIVAYSSDYDKASYYLASVADTVIVHPFGLLEINGFASEGMFFAKAFEKYGVQVQVTRVGKYKSAVEPFLLDRMSDANREQLAALLGDLWDTFLQAISESRKVPVPELQRIADERGFVMAKDLLATKLVDRVAYWDEVLEDLKKITGNKPDDRTFNQIEIQDYVTYIQKNRPPKRSKNRVAVIYAEGQILDGDSKTDVGGDTLARLLRRARRDDRVKAVVLRVNSPGGSASASEVIQREVRLTREKKPFVVSMGTVAASGGYWISTYGDRIFAEPNTITGSIGVFGMLPNVQKLINNLGLNVDTVKTAEHADLTSIFRPKTDDEIALIQREVDWIYTSFVDRVCESRKLPRARVEEMAQGRVWSGADAKTLGLVDEIGGLQHAIDYAVEKGKVKDDYQLLFYQQPRTLFEQIVESLQHQKENDRANDGMVLDQARRLVAEVRRFAALNDPRGVYARLPFDIVPR